MDTNPLASSYDRIMPMLVLVCYYVAGFRHSTILCMMKSGIRKPPMPLKTLDCVGHGPLKSEEQMPADIRGMAVVFLSLFAEVLAGNFRCQE